MLTPNNKKCVCFRTFEKMDKRKKANRYFNDIPEEKSETKFKLKNNLKFDGNVIKVEMKPLKFQKMKLNKKYVKPNLDQNILKKHSRGGQISRKGVKTNFFKEKVKRKEVVLEYATEQAARSEALRNETEG